MNFDQVKEEIRQLIGQRLHSIRAGAEIIIEKIDESRVHVKANNGIIKSRPLAELSKIWDALCTFPAVHVDTVLGGSSSSRNQPETIMANLPFIEYLYLSGKKHLVLVEPSHPYATLKCVNPIKSVEIAERSRNIAPASNKPALVIVVTKNLADVAASLEEITGSKAILVEEGIYVTDCRTHQLYLVASGLLPNGFAAGTYIVTKGMFPTTGGTKLEILGKTLYAYSDGSMNLLIELAL